MNLCNTKVLLSAFGIVALLASPAFAQKRQHVTHYQSNVSSAVPSYNKDGAIVATPNPDQR
jgi:hypothetical protein